ncbi:MAG: ROK family protein [candidate division Zixibacteria bacterium]|nr:ROK family protein [candidate division Zixibacteria bacterium]
MSVNVYAGIDIGATNIKYGLVDREGNIRYRDQTTTPKNALAEALFEKIVVCGERLLVEADESGATVGYIGVGSPGSVNMTTGVVQGGCPNMPLWEGFHLRDRLSERLNLPVMVDNDANCAAAAEHRFGVGKGYDNIICLTIGTGIGGGLIIGGKIYRGANFSAGEVGHLLVGGEDAAESSQFLETLVSSKAILVRLKQRLTGDNTPVFDSLVGDDMEQLTIKKLFQAARRGDRAAVEVIQTTARILGTALAGLVNVLNPEIVILGGGIAEGGKEFVDIVRDTIKNRALAAAIEGLDVVPARLGNAAGFIGAAFLGVSEPDE